MRRCYGGRRKLKSVLSSPAEDRARRRRRRRRLRSARVNVQKRDDNKI